MRALDEIDTATRPAEGQGPGEAAEQQDSHVQVLALIRQLPENQREVVRLKFQNDLSYKEIASITELSVSNVGFLLHTALRTLRAQAVAAGE